MLSKNLCSPVTVPDCKNHFSQGKCEVCNAGKFPSLVAESGLINCSAVPADVLVPNCAQYKSAGVCEACEANYFLHTTSTATATATVCKSVTQLNCKKFNSFGFCKSCAEGKVLVPLAPGQKPHIRICDDPPQPVANVDNLCTLFEGAKCVECTPDSLSVNGTCQKRAARVPHCYKHAISAVNPNAVTCVQCEGSKVL